MMEIVKGNTEFIKVDQTPRTWRVSLNVWDHFYRYIDIHIFIHNFQIFKFTNNN